MIAGPPYLARFLSASHSHAPALPKGARFALLSLRPLYPPSSLVTSVQCTPPPSFLGDQDELPAPFSQTPPRQLVVVTDSPLIYKGLIRAEEGGGRGHWRGLLESSPPAAAMGASSIAWRTSVDYMKRSSIAGLSHAANSRSYVRSLYWLLVFVVGLALTVRSLANLVEEFLDYPVVTSSHLTTKPSVAFPAVTICNINRVNCVNLEEEALNLHKEGRLNESVKMVQFSIDIGCRAQVCNSVGITISGRREGPWLDSRAFAMGELGCKVHLEDKKLVNQMCYYYHTIKEYDEDVTAEAKAMAQKVTFFKKRN